MNNVDNMSLMERLIYYETNKIKVTLQVKDLEQTTGIRHWPENMGGERDKYITGIIELSKLSNKEFIFKEDGKERGQFVIEESLSKIKPVNNETGDPTSLEGGEYKQKYLKYKQKYLELRARLQNL
jgi:hypothetical protein